MWRRGSRPFPARTESGEALLCAAWRTQAGNEFCSVLFCSVLFCSVLFCSVLFCSVLFCAALHSTAARVSLRS
jgi:hypothetical protein